MVFSTGTTQSIWGLTANITSSSLKIQPQQPSMWRIRARDRNTINLQLQWRSCGLFHDSASHHKQGLISVLKCWQWKDERYPSNGVIPICAISRTPHTVPIATQGSLFGQFPGNSVITACPEMNVGRVDSGWRACGGVFFWGGDLLETSSGCHPPPQPQLRLSGRGSVSFLFGRRLLFSGPSVLTCRRTDARNAAFEKKEEKKNKALVLLVRTGQSSLNTFSNAQSHHAMTYRLTVLQPSCISIASANKILYDCGGPVCGRKKR